MLPYILTLKLLSCPIADCEVQYIPVAPFSYSTITISLSSRILLTADMIDYPTIEEGVEGLAFVEACLESSRNGNIWVDVK